MYLVDNSSGISLLQEENGELCISVPAVSIILFFVVRGGFTDGAVPGFHCLEARFNTLPHQKAWLQPPGSARK
jgi:hypothetical protein